MTEDPYKWYYHGMNLEGPLMEVIEERIGHFRDDGVKIKHNDLSDVKIYAGQKGGVDHIIEFGDNKAELEDKNLKKYKDPQSIKWTEGEIIKRHSQEVTDKYLISTYEFGSLAETAKQNLVNLKHNLIFVGQKVTAKNRNLIKQILHKKLTPLFNKVGNWVKLQGKKNELHSKRRKGYVSPNNKQPIVRKLSHYTHRGNTVIGNRDKSVRKRKLPPDRVRTKDPIQYVLDKFLNFKPRWLVDPIADYGSKKLGICTSWGEIINFG